MSTTNTRARPSSLPHLEACPRWVGRPKTETKDELDEAADEGTLLHEKLENLASLPVDAWPETIENDPELGPAMKPLVAESADQVRDLFMFGLPVATKKSLGLSHDFHYELRDALDGVYCECGLDAGVVAPGTADLLMIQGNRAVLVDYKSNRVARDHDRQVEAYVLGVFNASPKTQYVEARIVAPRLGGVHPARNFTRDDVPRLRQVLLAIVERAADPFTPGCPGTQCVFCAGNARCPYQAASLKDVPVATDALVSPGMWGSLMGATTPELRSERRMLVKWLETFVDAVKEDDKQWALDNPEATLPGITKSIQQGRASLDKTRLAEVNEAIRLTFGWDYATLEAFLSPNRDKIVEFAALQTGKTQDEVKKLLAKTLVPFEVRGAPVITFRMEKKARAKELKQ